MLSKFQMWDLNKRKMKKTIVLVPPREISNNLAIHLRYIYIYIYTSWGCIATSTQLHWKKITNCILWKQVHGPKLDMSLAFNNKGDGSQWGLKLNLNMIYVTMWKCKAYVFATKGYSYLTNLTYQSLDNECGIALIWHCWNQGKMGTFKLPIGLKTCTPWHACNIISFTCGWNENFEMLF